MIKWILLAVLTLFLGAVFFGYYQLQYAENDIYVPLFADNCGACHGEDLMGTSRAGALLERRLDHGDSLAALVHSISEGDPDRGMPGYADRLSDTEIKGLAIYIGERRLGQRFTDFRYTSDVEVPADVVQSQAHNFTIEVFADNLDPMPYSIEPLPDGTLLLTEKERGLSILSREGVQSEYIKGTPEAGAFNFDLRGIQLGLGWLLDVAVHPDYENNGWIYLHYTHICAEACEEAGITSFLPLTMNRLDRGRIRNGEWVDVETIWRAPPESYTSSPDTAAGGRIAFDDDGHVYITVGMKGTDPVQDGSQNLDEPYGKIHRINDDGSVPADNPFVVSSGEDDARSFTKSTTWTYGHRSPLGLEWNAERRRAWNAEMGPRGGDEINELLPGRNYGWPYHSLGLEYSGEVVARHKWRDLEFDASEVEQTLVDFTPSPAISSFAFYHGSAFPEWEGNVLLGSLKGSSLFRLVFDGNRLIHKETLIKDLARIRDVEIGHDGLVYLLLENKAGSKVVRLVPQATVEVASVD